MEKNMNIESDCSSDCSSCTFVRIGIYLHLWSLTFNHFLHTDSSLQLFSLNRILSLSWKNIIYVFNKNNIQLIWIKRHQNISPHGGYQLTDHYLWMEAGGPLRNAKCTHTQCFDWCYSSTAVCNVSHVCRRCGYDELCTCGGGCSMAATTSAGLLSGFSKSVGIFSCDTRTQKIETFNSEWPSSVFIRKQRISMTRAVRVPSPLLPR